MDENEGEEEEIQPSQKEIKIGTEEGGEEKEQKMSSSSIWDVKESQ